MQLMRSVSLLYQFSDDYLNGSCIALEELGLRIWEYHT